MCDGTRILIQGDKTDKNKMNNIIINIYLFLNNIYRLYNFAKFTPFSV